MGGPLTSRFSGSIHCDFDGSVSYEPSVQHKPPARAKVLAPAMWFMKVEIFWSLPSQWVLVHS
ncbi:unnamed protein product, partial [Gulo gulo]